MKKISLLSVFAIIFTLGLFSTNYSQTEKVIGKLYSKAEANSVYGAVKTSLKIDTEVLKHIISRTPDKILFNIVNGNLMVLNADRSVLFSNDVAQKSVKSDVIFHMFSTSQVAKLLELGGNNPTTTIELRDNNILTVTNGEESLEFSQICPPNCW